MPERFRKPSRPDFRLDQMFETHSEEWKRVGLAVDFDKKSLRAGRRRLAVFVPLFIAVIVVYSNYQTWFGKPNSSWETPIQIATVLALLALGWAIARDIGRVAGPTFFRRMDPGTAGTVGFLVRLVTVGITLLVALEIAGVSAASLVATSAFTAVILGLAAQQTLGNLFAGMVLLSARPFRVGERVRFQAGAVGGQIEGIVSSLGLLYTTLAQGEDRIMVPNNVVLSAVVVPIREPEAVDVRVRLGTGIRVSQVQAILDDNVKTPTRRSATVLLEQLDGDDLVVRVQATPERADDGARLADEIIDALASVTGEHPTVANDGSEPTREGEEVGARRP
ncbi:MAG TPA: mechanosensitive ion channel family protein [Solirubrobacteraceae bacterium]|nr:mechanosensitive ion channel family protein [Solirubrobacteraceae bacterium]